ncbi:bifunctional riboflavin kinase/FAD synthetase [Bacteroidota bacterium]
MKIHTDIVKLHINNPVVTIGIFDGVHVGHLSVIDHLKKRAKELNGESVIITFWPHPRLVLSEQKQNIRFLNSLEEKQILLEKAGIDHLIIIPFTKRFSRLSAKKFIKKYLLKKIRTKHLIIGFNHQFGRKRKGNYKVLKKYADKYKFSIEKLDAILIEKEKVSSSIIRESLEKGNLEISNKYLGYDYLLRGIIVKGKKVGRTIGFPTANIELDDRCKLIPKDGVYAVFVAFERKVYKGMLNIGIRPTMKDTTLRKYIEVHILNFDKDIYNQKITIIFVSRIREEQKFDGLDSLKIQLEKDKKDIIPILDKSNSKIISSNKLYHERNIS